MKMFNTKQNASTQLRSAVEEFLANGGTVTKIKPKKTPKGVLRTNPVLMGPSKRIGNKTA
jgi:hypothetical protein